MTSYVTPSALAIIALSPALYPQQGKAKNGVKQPNIILFMVDDMGWQDTSVPFAPYITPYNKMYLTPNMERLASQSVRFTNAYAAPVSSPSRCSLMTGMNMARHRVTNWTLHRNQMTDAKREGIDLPQWNYNGITQQKGVEHTTCALSFVQLLKRAGYRTIHCGKAHWGAIGTPGENPLHFGFDVNITGTAAGGLATYLSEQNYGHTSDGKPTSPFSLPGLEAYWGTGTFATEALTQEALKALDVAKAQKKPFYLYLSHYAVHVPIDKDMRFYKKHLDRGLTPKEAAYASLVEGMDKSLGDVMQWIERNGEAKNTIIIFMSDNGGLASSSYWREGPLYTQNAPLRSGKCSLYEGGIRVPLIVHWPGVTKAQQQNPTPVVIEDLYPTLLEMANIRDYKVPQTLDGRNLVPLLKGHERGLKNRWLVWNFPNIWDGEGLGISLNCAIREGNWKLIYTYDTGRKELYNLSSDLEEAHDCSAQYPAMVKRLSHHLAQRLRAMNAQRPTFHATGKPCLWPDE